MRLWRLTATKHAATAFDGEGAARYAGRWNPRGVRMVYTAGSLALATLELAVHLPGARVAYTAIEIDIDDASIDELDVADLRRTWRSDQAATRRIGASWVRSARSFGLLVPSVLIDHRSGEGNVLLDPTHPDRDAMTEIQRFRVTIDERLTT